MSNPYRSKRRFLQPPIRGIFQGIKEIVGVGRSGKKRHSEAVIHHPDRKRQAQEIPQIAQAIAGPLHQVAAAIPMPRRYVRRSRKRRYTARVRRRSAPARTKAAVRRLNKVLKICEPTLAYPIPTTSVVSGSVLGVNLNQTLICSAVTNTATEWEGRLGGFQVPTPATNGVPIELISLGLGDEQKRTDMCITPKSFNFRLHLNWPFLAQTSGKGAYPIPQRVELWIVKAQAGLSLYSSSAGLQTDTGYCDAYRVRPEFNYTGESLTFGRRDKLMSLFKESVHQMISPVKYQGGTVDLRDVMKVVKRKVWRHVVPDQWKQVKDYTAQALQVDKYKDWGFTLKLKPREMNFRVGSTTPDGRFGQYYAFCCMSAETYPRLTALDENGSSNPSLTVSSSFRFKQ